MSDTMNIEDIRFGCDTPLFPYWEAEKWFNTTWTLDFLVQFETRAIKHIETMNWKPGLHVELKDLPRKVETPQLWDETVALFGRIAEVIRGKGLVPYSLHSTDLTPQLGLDATLQIQRIRLRQAAALGARIVVLHLSTDPSRIHNAFNPMESIEFDVSVLKALVPQAKELGLKLAVENIPLYPYRYLYEVVNRVECEEVGYTLDVGHITMREVPAGQVMNEMGPRLIHTHIHDNIGWADNHWDVGDGCISWPEIVNCLLRKQYTGCWMLEVLSYNPEPSVSRLKKYIAQVTAHSAK